MQFLVDPTDEFQSTDQVMSQPMGRHLLIETLEDRNLSSEFCETLLPSIGPAFHLPASGRD